MVELRVEWWLVIQDWSSDIAWTKIVAGLKYLGGDMSVAVGLQ